MELLQYTTEAFLVELFKEVQLAATFRIRVIIMLKDIVLAARMVRHGHAVLKYYKYCDKPSSSTYNNLLDYS